MGRRGPRRLLAGTAIAAFVALPLTVEFAPDSPPRLSWLQAFADDGGGGDDGGDNGGGDNGGGDDGGADDGGEEGDDGSEDGDDGSEEGGEDEGNEDEGGGEEGGGLDEPFQGDARPAGEDLSSEEEADAIAKGWQ